MYEKTIIINTADFVKEKLSGEGSGHDWWHVERVWKLARNISLKENANTFVVELAALLHDIADWKFTDGDETVGPRIAREWLFAQSAPIDITEKVIEIIEKVSFKGAGIADQMNTLEGKIVQDADRLDAIGAIGIARTFAYGGYKQREIYNPHVKPELHESFEAYKKNKGHTINHFYEKLLLLKDRMHTPAAKQMAEERHAFMQQFLDRFYKEWEGGI